MLARADSCKEDLICSGEESVLLFTCFACVSLVRAWVFEWWVSDDGVYVCTCCSVCDGAGVEKTLFFYFFVNDLSMESEKTH